MTVSKSRVVEGNEESLKEGHAPILSLPHSIAFISLFLGVNEELLKEGHASLLPEHKHQEA